MRLSDEVTTSVERCPLRSAEFPVALLLQSQNRITELQLEWFGRLIAPRPLSVGRAHQTKSVSNIHTDIPDRQNQQRELEAVAERHGWNVVAIFTDAGISGTKARDKRPGYDRLCRGIARREFDQVTAWSVDRLGRSLQELVAFLGELHAKGVDLYLHPRGIMGRTCKKIS